MVKLKLGTKKKAEAMDGYPDTPFTDVTDIPLRYASTKTFTHAQGLSCCFRQWRATHSHCSKLHGYAIEVKLEFRASRLDERNWVVDFGGLKEFKEWLVNEFDHTTVVALDDPDLALFEAMHRSGIIELRRLPNVGCEAFAAEIFRHYLRWFEYKQLNKDAYLYSVEVREHQGNSAIVTRGDV